MIEADVFHLALAHERAGEHSAALTLFRECLDQGAHDHGDLLFHCAWCLEQTPGGDKQEALSLYREAGRRATETACRMNGFFRAGWLQMQAGESAAAAADFRRALELGEPDSADELYRQSAYWHAVCLEAQGRFLEALEWYRLVQRISPLLAPESRFREIACCNQIGRYDDALAACGLFEAPPPVGFDAGRYDELRTKARAEKRMLERVLAVENVEGSPHAGGRAG